jgi:predicted dehydrogenase
MHYRFHPAWQAFISLITPSKIALADSWFPVPGAYLSANDIRLNYDLAGGSIMDPGTYPISALRQVFGTEPEECISSTVTLIPGRDKRIDKDAKATWRFPNGGLGSISSDMDMRGWFGIPLMRFPTIGVKQNEISLEDTVGTVTGQTHSVAKTVTFWNFVMPMYWHRIDITDEHIIRDAAGKVVKKWTEKESKKIYTWEQQKEGMVRGGEESWSTFRHELEEFVNRIKGRQGSGIWVEGEDSVKQMAMIDSAYLKAGLPIRPTSPFK